MKLHFVCTGNIFRSRLAESYANSLLAPDSPILVSSSGVKADHNTWGPMAWFTRQCLAENNLLDFASLHWTQSTSDILQAQDLIIFMQPFHLRYSRKHFGYTDHRHQVWQIPDISSSLTDSQLLDFTRSILSRLQPAVSSLITTLSSPNGL